jgi:hypothetical protein
VSLRASGSAGTASAGVSARQLSRLRNADIVVARQRARGACRGNDFSFMAGTPRAAVPGRPGPGGWATGGVSNG